MFVSYGSTQVTNTPKNLQTWKYPLGASVSRNILLLGRSQVGKTTFIRTLKNPDEKFGFGTGMANTAESSVYRFTMWSDQDELVNINIMDTEGLFMRSLEEKLEKANEVIVDSILQCVDKEFTKINGIYYFMTFQGSLHDNDFAAFRKFYEQFEPLRGIMTLVISFSERYDKDDIKN